MPNLVAGGLHSGKSRLVAALVSTLISPVFNETIQALNNQGYPTQNTLFPFGFGLTY